MPSAETFLQSAATAKDRPKAVYAVVGEEDYLRREVLAALLGYVTRVLGELDIVRMDGDATDLATLLDELRSRSLFGGKRLVLLSDYGGRRAFLDTHRDKLADYVRTPARDALLVIETPKLNKTLRLHKAIVAAGERIDCEPLKGQALLRWLTRRARDLRLELSPDAAEFMADTVGASLGMLAAELEKLDLYLGAEAGGKPQRVGRSTLEEVLGFRGAADSWALLEAIAAGDLRRSLEETERLLRNGESAYKLIGMLTYKLKQLWRGAGALAQGASMSAAATAAKVQRFQQNEFAAALKRYDLAACRAMLAELVKADRKDALLEVEQALEFLVITLCRGRGNGSGTRAGAHR